MWTGLLPFSAVVICMGELQITETVVSDVAYRWWKATEASIALIKMTFAGITTSKAPKSSVIILRSVLISLANATSAD